MIIKISYNNGSVAGREVDWYFVSSNGIQAGKEIDGKDTILFEELKMRNVKEVTVNGHKIFPENQANSDG